MCNDMMSIKVDGFNRIQAVGGGIVSSSVVDFFVWCSSLCALTGFDADL